MNLSSKQRILTALQAQLTLFSILERHRLLRKSSRLLMQHLKRGLIKVAVLKNCIDDPREIAQSVIGERTHSAVVSVINKK